MGRALAYWEGRGGEVRRAPVHSHTHAHSLWVVTSLQKKAVLRPLWLQDTASPPVTPPAASHSGHPLSCSLQGISSPWPLVLTQAPAESGSSGERW